MKRFQYIQSVALSRDDHRSKELINKSTNVLLVLNFELTRLFIEKDFYEALDTKSRRRAKSTLAQINLSD